MRRTLLICGGALLLSGCAGSTGHAPASRPPNIVLIMADDAGLEVFPAWGGAAYQTPHIDALVASGIRFTQAYSHPLCTPSRIALMTGRLGYRNYVEFGILDPSERTFAHLLGAQGYATSVVGKWQLYGPDSYGEWQGKGTRPEDAGFDRWCLWQVETLGQRYFQPTVEVDGELRVEAPDRYGPDVFCDYALEFMTQHREQPFLLYYPMALVHAPFERTPALEAGVETRREERFAAMVEAMDQAVGRLVAGLEDLGLREQTLVLFTSDNGTDGSITVPHGDGAVTGGKGLTTARGTHVPMVASWPGTVPAGVDYRELVDFTDVLPTLCDVAGSPVPDDLVLDGRSFAPQLRGQPGQPRQTLACYYFPRPRRPQVHAEAVWVQTTQYKLYSDGRLFDLEKDPDERAPLDHRRLGEGGERELWLLEDALAEVPAWPARIPRELVESAARPTGG